MMNNTGETIVKKWFNDYVNTMHQNPKNYNLFPIFVLNDISIPFTNTNNNYFSVQFDHILLSQKVIISYETKCWSGTTHICTLEDAKKSFLPLDSFPRYPKNASNGIIIFNIQEDTHATSKDNYSFHVSSYSKKDKNIIYKLVQNNQQLAKYLHMDKFFNRFIFINSPDFNKNVVLSENARNSPHLKTYSKILLNYNDFANDLDEFFNEPDRFSSTDCYNLYKSLDIYSDHFKNWVWDPSQK